MADSYDTTLSYEFGIPAEATPRQALTWLVVNKNSELAEETHGLLPKPISVRRREVAALIEDPDFNPLDELMTMQEINARLTLSDEQRKAIIQQARSAAIQEAGVGELTPDYEGPATMAAELAAEHTIRMMQGQEEITLPAE